MSISRVAPVLLPLLLAATPEVVRSQAPPDPAASPGVPDQPLFARSDVLPATLEVEDLGRVIRDVGDDNEDHPAMLSYRDSSGALVSVTLEVETRGNFRRNRRNCDFPPLMLEFPDSGTPPTLFGGQEDLKLVNPCREDRKEYEQYVILEYLIYRVYNLITDRSFRVRPLRLTYVDRSGKRDSLVTFAFVIEDHERLARRLGCTVLDVQAHPLEFSPQETARMALFQYLVANTDWSVAFQHNVKQILCADYEAVAVPYDFDWSGLIATRYAKPDPKLPIRSVRQRLFRGFCRDEAIYGEAARSFLERREDIRALFLEQEGLDPDVRERTLEYIDEFYEVLEDRGKFKREILDACRRT